MKNIIFKYGIISGAVIIISAIFTIILVGESGSFSIAEWLGYLIMIVALSMIFIGIKDYKRKNNNKIDFKSAFLVGLGISAVASLLYVIGWEVYFSINGEQFISDYSNNSIQKLIDSGASTESVNTAKEKLNESMELYRNMPYRIAITTMEIFPIALVITLISSFILRTKTAKQVNNE
jgi:uncharacterized membrane protein (DUF373 family)